MKKFSLDLSEYKVDVPVSDKLAKVEIYPLRENISGWLRMAGIFKTGEEIVEAVVLGKTIEKSTDDKFLLDEREATILKQCLNKHLALSEAGRTGIPLGGKIHEEAICRVFGMKEVNNGPTDK